MSEGKVLAISVIALSIFSVSSKVLVPGCFAMVIIIAGLAFSEPSPILGIAPPILISAISSIFIGTLLTTLITALPISSTLFVLPTPLMMYSLPNSFMKPPEALRLLSLLAFSTSFKEML